MDRRGDLRFDLGTSSCPPPLAITTARLWVSVGDENASLRSRLTREQRHAEACRRFKQTEALEKRLSKEAEQLRKEARGTPPGIEREQLIKRARQADTASHMTEWLTSPGLQPPK